MTVRWVARIPQALHESLGTFRLELGVEALAMGDDIYLRGECESSQLPPQVRALPGQLFTVLADDQLVKLQHRTPTGRMPIGHWSPLPQFLQVSLPQAAFDAECPTPIALALERSAIHRESNLLVLSVQHWSEYVESESETRLRRLRFTWRPATQTALVHGSPMPPIPGERWVEDHGIATPAGWKWAPAISADVVARAFHINPGDVVMLHPNREAERIDAELWAPALHSPVRLSLAADDPINHSPPSAP